MKYAILVCLVVLSLGLVSCASQAPEPTNSNSFVGKSATDKVGTTTKEGIISESGGRFFIAGSGQAPEEIESYVVDLTFYVGQEVRVSGQYSGDTLFVGEVE